MLSVRLWATLREKSPYSEFFWFYFFRIWFEYGEISVQMREDTNQKYKCGHFSHNARHIFCHMIKSFFRFHLFLDHLGKPKMNQFLSYNSLLNQTWLTFLTRKIKKMQIQDREIINLFFRYFIKSFE